MNSLLDSSKMEHEQSNSGKRNNATGNFLTMVSLSRQTKCQIMRISKIKYI